MRLPRGVALVRIQTPEKRVVLLSKALTRDQALAAKVFAAVLANDGQPYVMLRMVDVLAAMNAAA